MNRHRLKLLAKRKFATILYRRPQSTLKPERLYAYLDALWQRRDLHGAVVEVGCYMGGTAALASLMLRNTGFPKRYVCIDTFSGFVPDHFDHDVSSGLRSDWRTDFSANSLDTVRHLINHYGCKDVELVQGNIVTLDESLLPDKIVACLVDVDLEIPTYEGLHRVATRLVPGGIVLVDDCERDEVWPGPRTAYRRFVSDYGLSEQYAMGMGVVTRDAA